MRQCKFRARITLTSSNYHLMLQLRLCTFRSADIHHPLGSHDPRSSPADPALKQATTPQERSIGGKLENIPFSRIHHPHSVIPSPRVWLGSRSQGERRKRPTSLRLAVDDPARAIPILVRSTKHGPASEGGRTLIANSAEVLEQKRRWLTSSSDPQWT